MDDTIVIVTYSHYKHAKLPVVKTYDSIDWAISCMVTYNDELIQEFQALSENKKILYTSSLANASEFVKKYCYEYIITDPVVIVGKHIWQKRIIRTDNADKDGNEGNDGDDGNDSDDHYGDDNEDYHGNDEVLDETNKIIEDRIAKNPKLKEPIKEHTYTRKNYYNITLNMTNTDDGEYNSMEFSTADDVIIWMCSGSITMSQKFLGLSHKDKVYYTKTLATAIKFWEKYNDFDEIEEITITTDYPPIKKIKSKKVIASDTIVEDVIEAAESELSSKYAKKLLRKIENEKNSRISISDESDSDNFGKLPIAKNKSKNKSINELSDEPDDD